MKGQSHCRHFVAEATLDTRLDIPGRTDLSEEAASGSHDEPVVLLDLRSNHKPQLNPWRIGRKFRLFVCVFPKNLKCGSWGSETELLTNRCWGKFAPSKSALLAMALLPKSWGPDKHKHSITSGKRGKYDKPRINGVYHQNPKKLHNHDMTICYFRIRV